MATEPLSVEWRQYITDPEAQQTLRRLEGAGVTFEWRKEDFSERLEAGQSAGAVVPELDRAVTTNAVFVATRGGVELARETDMGAGSIEEAVRLVLQRAARRVE